MKRSIRISIVIFHFLISLSMLAAQKSYAVESLAPLEIEILTSEKPYLVDEPFVISIILKNRGSKNLILPVNAMADPGDGLLTLDISDIKNKRIGYDPEGVSDVLFPPTFRGNDLTPGSKYSIWLDLTWQSGQKRTLSKPGVYVIKAHYVWQNKSTPGILLMDFHSKPVTFEVKAPEQDELRAHDLFVQVPMPTPENIEKRGLQLKDLLQRYPKSVYAKYAHVRLAEHLEILGAFKDNALYGEAIKQWKEISEKYPRFGYTEYAKEREGFIYMRTGKYQQAKQVFNELLKSPNVADSRKTEIDLILKDDLKDK